MQTHTMKWAYIKDKGTFTVIDKKLHFLDCVSKEWEECMDCVLDVLTTKDIKKLINKLGQCTIYHYEKGDILLRGDK